MNLFTRLFESVPVAVKESAIDQMAALPALFPEEEALLTRAVLKRRVEFSTGRQLAREALAELGIAAAPIPANTDRSPVWPDNVVGAITHCNSWCAAGVAFKNDIRYLGMDIEEYLLRKMDAGMIDHICVPEERDWLSSYRGDMRRRAAMAVFSAKEAWYKAGFPTAQTFLDFKGARISFESFDDHHAIWRGVLLKDWGPFRSGDSFPFGRSLFDDRYVASVFIRLNDTPVG
ncbi:MAG: 4'-phosphopantetheinyl transferase superfamily protein [Deltaproteobacteria bacterium]|nr:4'-phosphopantetheinyl transferase superfamily protein [Deltaproteobacteria bacterium]